MLLVIPVSHVDYQRGIELVQWISELDAYPRHSALLVASKTLSKDQLESLLSRLRVSGFNTVEAIQLHAEDKRGWPHAPNLMFGTAVDYITSKPGKSPFFWLEPDALPLKAGWLDSLESEYRKSGKPFMGAIFGKPWPHMTGVAVYPQEINTHNPYMVHAVKLPFDTVRPDLVLPKAASTNLIEHQWGIVETNTPPTFPTIESLDSIPRQAVIFHRCKDGTLLARIREARNPTPTKPRKRGYKFGFLSSIIPHRPDSVVIRRSGAYGDALSCSFLSRKIEGYGLRPIFQTSKECATLLKLVPKLKLDGMVSMPDINLDGVYEVSKDIGSKHFAEFWTEAANKHLLQKGISIKPVNFAPDIHIKKQLTRRFISRFENVPRPWIGVIPRSNSFNVRTVPDKTWAAAAPMIHGSCFWFGTHTPAPPGLVKFPIIDIVNTAIGISAMDLVLTVDTGPAHIAAALKVPMIVIEQASSPELHFSDQRDFSVIRPPNLTCLNCQLRKCKFSPNSPPCQCISEYEISSSANRRLDAMGAGKVSAVICIYKSNASRLNRCLDAIINQVDEIVICCDAGDKIPDGTMPHPKIRVVHCRLPDSGYGWKLNTGVRHTVNDFILAVNDDIYLDNGAVDELLRVMNADSDCAVVGNLLWYPGRKEIQHGGTTRGPGDIGWGHIDHHNSTPSIKQVVECENVTGASILIRRSAFHDVSGMDEQYRLYYEDNAFNLRVRKGGWKIYYTPHAQGIHDEHSSTKQRRDISAITMESAKVFEADWGKYFTHNAKNTMGDFNY